MTSFAPSPEEQAQWAKESAELKQKNDRLILKAIEGSQERGIVAMESPWYVPPGKRKEKRKKYKHVEGSIQSDVMKWLTLKGVWVWRVNNSGMPVRDSQGRVVGLKKSTLPEGHSDLAGILPGGRALYIEMKSPGKKPSSDQRKFIARVNKEGGLAFWADSLDTVMEHVDKPLAPLS